MEYEKAIFTGGLDMDTDPRMMRPGDYRHALNMRVMGTENGEQTLAELVPGMVDVPFGLPSGDNRCLGSYEYGQGGVCYYFVYNSLDNHLILRFNPNVGSNGEIVPVASGPSLGFGADDVVSGVFVVDGLLYWTTGTGDPRKLNADKGVTAGKRREIRLYFEPIEMGDTRSGALTLVVNGLPVLFPYSIGPVDTLGDFLRQFASAWNAAGVGTFMAAESCGTFIGLTSIQPDNTYDIPLFTCIDSSAGVRQTHWQPWNWYPAVIPHTDRLVKRPPMATPVLSPGVDAGIPGSYLDGHSFQFRLRYTFDDNEKSVWGPVSSPLFVNKGCGGDTPNYIDITFPDYEDGVEILRDREYLSTITGVDIAVREGNSGEWRLVTHLDQQDFVLSPVYRFYNDGIYQVLDPSDTGLLWHSVPITAGTLELIHDSETQRMAVADIVEGYDNVCMDVALVADYDQPPPPSVVTRTVRARIRIANPIGAAINPFNPAWSAGYNTNQVIHSLGNDNNGGVPISPNPGYVYGGMGALNQLNPSVLGYESKTGTAYGQWIPEGGWPGYLAGTDYVGVSKQEMGPYGTPVAGNPNVYDTSTTALRNGARANIEVLTGPLPYSVLEITNIPEGEYILRLGSHLCSYDDKLGLGPNYDLNQGRGYQRTSTNLSGVSVLGQSLPADEFRHEVYIRVEATQVLASLDGAAWSAVSSDADIEFVVDDYTPAYKNMAGQGITPYGALISHHIASGYLYDNADSTVDNGIANVLNGQACELQTMVCSRHIDGFIPPIWFAIYFANPTVFSEDESLIRTDHNGYYRFAFAYIDTQIFREMRLGVVSVTADGGTPNGYINGWSWFGGVTVTNLLLMKDFTDPGHYEGYLNASALTAPAGVNYDTTTEGNHPSITFFAVADAEIHRAVKTYVEGSVLTPAGQGVPNVLVQMDRTNRSAVTGVDGAYRVTLFADTRTVYPGSMPTNNDDRDYRAFMSYAGTCRVTLQPSSTIVAGTIQFFNTEAAYSYDFGLTGLPDVIAVVYDSSTTGLKHGGVYQFGLVYWDYGGRGTFVNTDEGTCTLRLPFFTEDIPDTPQYTNAGAQAAVFPVVGWTINHPVPRPAEGYFTHYSWFRTRNGAINGFVQFAASDVEYVRSWDGSTPDLTTWAAGDAREIAIALDFGLYAGDVSGSVVSYQFNQGDRIRFIRTGGGLLFNGLLDFEVTGQRGNYVIIDYTPLLPELTQGTLVEIYTPKLKVDDEFYYECSPVYVIDSPATNPVHSVVSDNFTTWDTCFRPRLIPLREVQPASPTVRRLFYVEDAGYSDTNPETVQDIGRVSAVSDTVSQIHRPTYIQASNPYIPSTKINGFNAFEGLNGKELNRAYGDIERLAEVDNVLLAICRNKAVSIYVGKAVLRDVEGSGVVSVTDSVLSSINELAGDCGTYNPESVVRNRGYVYWWDVYRGRVWRYSAGGISAISDVGMNGFWHREGANRWQILTALGRPLRSPAVYDQPAEEYILTMEGIDIRLPQYGYDDRPVSVMMNAYIADSFTAAWRERGGAERWSAFYSFTPEAYARVGNRTMAFDSGGLWVMWKNQVMGKFFGVKYAGEITPVFRGESPSKRKVWLALAVEGSEGWYSPAIMNENRQRTELSVGDFAFREFDWYAHLWKDINTAVDNPLVEGDEMRSHYLLVLLRNDGDDRRVIFAANAGSIPSERSNR